MRKRRRRIEYPDELYHFGVKGMKWGVRKDRNKKAYARARRIVDRADRGKSPLMSLARKLGKARAKAGLHSPRDKRIILKECNNLAGSLVTYKIKNDKAYKEALERSRKAERAYDKENAKYVDEGFPKSREKTLNNLAMEIAKADGTYQKEWRRINAEARSEAIETTYKKYGYI